MARKLLRSWKKVYESDLPYVVSEMKEMLEIPSAIFLQGEVGSGKTTFCRYFITDAPVQSPTYQILYETPSMVHADFYRIEKREELYPLEIHHYLEGKEYFLLEWGKKFYHFLSQELGEDFHYYELECLVNKQTDRASRDYFLHQLDPY